MHSIYVRSFLGLQRASARILSLPLLLYVIPNALTRCQGKQISHQFLSLFLSRNSIREKDCLVNILPISFPWTLELKFICKAEITHVGGFLKE